MQVDGTLVIFDVETSGIASKLRGHTRQIQSLRFEIAALSSVRVLIVQKLVK